MRPMTAAVVAVNGNFKMATLNWDLNSSSESTQDENPGNSGEGQALWGTPVHSVLWGLGRGGRCRGNLLCNVWKAHKLRWD